MNGYRRYLFFAVVVLALLAIGSFVYFERLTKISIKEYSSLNRRARIYPEYCGTVIPPNIAPLNFIVQEKGKYFYVKIYSRQGKPVEVFSRKPEIVIPKKSWQSLLGLNKGNRLNLDIYVEDANNKWNRFETVSNTIANEDIDNGLVYRKIHPDSTFWKEIGIYQRNLSNYDESPILKNESFDGGCVNCHTFCNNQPDKVMYPIRSDIYGIDSLLVEDGDIQKIGTKFTYSCWHPSGKLITFSANKIVLFFHSSRSETRDVVDTDSLLAYYDIDSKKLKTTSNISRKDYLETYPAWSPDGRFLYFCCAPKLWPDDTQIPPKQYDKVKYDLMRISYDIINDKWGELETVISSKDTGLSVTLPRISPDGRWLLFCMADYGCFNAYSKSSDLYLMDMNSVNQASQNRIRKPAINSDESESWHCWSSNSRWIVFSSKRDNGIFTRLYISYVDKDGVAYKPLILPQKDPLFYDSCLLTYNTPELVKEPVLVGGENLARVIRSSQKIPTDMPITMATPKAVGTPAAAQPRQRE